MRKIRYIIPLYALLVISISSIAQDPPPPGGGGAPTGGNTPVSTPLSAVAIVIAGAGVALFAWKGQKHQK